jgi:NADP-dependent 3-hydroxy acid dehydrogenase YdfG
MIILVTGATAGFGAAITRRFVRDGARVPARRPARNYLACGGGTEFSGVRFKDDKAKADAVYAGIEPLTAEDIAETVQWVTSRPPRVNNTVSLMPVCQAFAPFAVSRSV